MKRERLRRGVQLGWAQFRLGTFLIVVTVVGCLAGRYGPDGARWLRTVRTPPPPATFPAGVRFSSSDELPAYYLEPAETPLD